MERAIAREKGPIDARDLEAAKTFWLHRFPFQDDKLRMSVVAGVDAMLHAYNTGIGWDKISTGTNVTPADLPRGKWVLVNYPVSEHKTAGRIVLNAFKLATQDFILRRKAKSGDVACGVVADEAQNVTTSGGADFMQESRSHYGFTIYLTQRVNSLYGNIGREASKAKAKVLMANATTKIAHVLGDTDSAKFFSELIGTRRERFTSISSKETTLGEAMLGGDMTNWSVSDKYEPILRETAFLGGGLRTGARPMTSR